MFFHMFHGLSHLNQYILNEDWNAVKNECELHPREAKEWTTRTGFFDGEHDSHVLPIHQACALHAPRDALNALILAYPQGVHSKETSFRRLPIHISCQSGATADVVELLLSYYPEGAHAQDELGRYPIHYACSNGASPDVVEALLNADPRSTAHTDIHGWLPIHVACHFGASVEVVEKLLIAYPNAVTMKTDKGSTPLKLINKINCKDKDQIISLLENDLVSRKQNAQSTSIPIYNSCASESCIRRRPFQHAA